MICSGKTTFVDSAKILLLGKLKQNFDCEKETIDRACIINLVWVFNPQHNI